MLPHDGEHDLLRTTTGTEGRSSSSQFAVDAETPRLVLNFQLGLLRDVWTLQSLQAFSSQPCRLPSVIFVSAVASEPHLCYVNYFFSHLPERWRLFLFLLLSPEAAGMKRLLFSSGIWAWTHASVWVRKQSGSCLCTRMCSGVSRGSRLRMFARDKAAV